MFQIYNPKAPHMQDLAKRIESFQGQWPESNTQTPKQIAEAGFYYTGKELSFEKKQRLRNSINSIMIFSIDWLKHVTQELFCTEFSILIEETDIKCVLEKKD